jgi:hypothetical protein
VLIRFNAQRRLTLCVLGAFLTNGCSNSPLQVGLATHNKVPESVHTIKAPAVNFCDLVGNPEVYNNQLVRTQALVIAGFETAYMYDPQCDGRDTRVYFEYGNDESVKELESLLGEFIRGEAKKVNVIVTGRFESSDEETYGHLNSFRHRLVSTDVASSEMDPAK